MPATNAATPCAADGGSLAGRFAATLDQLGSPLNGRFALAVSGGGDSVALMHLAADWLNSRKRPLECGAVLIVDHGLRSGSGKDAAVAAAWAREAGFSAQVLKWRGAKPRSDLEKAARDARYRLLGEWCRANGVTKLLLAHTLDDQAETFLLRLGRGSGVDGLSAMRERSPFPLSGYGIESLRPLLAIRREELRRELVERGVPWIEDPMNGDQRFARVRIRKVLPVLESAGVSSARMAEAARHLARAREALDTATARFLDHHAHFTPEGVALIDGGALALEPREIGLRALSALLLRVSGRIYRPRFERLERLFEALGNSNVAHTLSGCRVGRAPRQSRVFGAKTLEIRREAPRRRGDPSDDAARESAGKHGSSAASKGKLPQKGRIIGRLSGS